MSRSVGPAQRRVVVDGGDARAAALVAGALADGDAVTVVAPEVCATIDDLAGRGLLAWHPRDLTLDDVRAADVVLRPGVAGVGAAADRAADSHDVMGISGLHGSRTVQTEDSRAIGHVEPGSVTLVGAGPGDPDLLTVGGRRALERADVVVTDRLVPLAALGWTRPDALVVDVGKVPFGRSTSQDDINALLVEHALAGRDVVRLKGGDSFVFGRGGEELLACRDAGLEVRVVPGVTSSVAGPALAGIPVTHRGATQGFTVVSGHVPPDHPDSTVDWKALASAGTTIVVLMGVRTLPAISATLVAGGLDPATPAAVVADAGLPSQRVVVADVSTVAERAAEAGLGSPAVTVIGDVVGVLGEPT